MTSSFNIVYIPGSARYQSLFTLSLLKWSDCSFRLVANGCSPEEVRWLQRLCSTNPRLEFLALPFEETVEHGQALSYVQRLERSDRFCFMDADILAIDDFPNESSPCLDRCTGFFSCLPICFKDEEKTLPGAYPGVFGRHHYTEEGICLGGTYFAIYDNQALTRAIQSTGVDFRRLWWADIPRPSQDSLVRMGLSREWYDTGKVLNLCLIAQGERLIYREALALQHIGGVSIVGRSGYRPPGRGARSFPATEAGRLITRRKRIIALYFAQVLRALFEDRPLPVRPAIGEPDIEEKIERVSSHVVNLVLEHEDLARELLRQETRDRRRAGLAVQPEGLSPIPKRREELKQQSGEDPEVPFRPALAEKPGEACWRGRARKAVASLPAVASRAVVGRLAQLVEADFTAEPRIWVDHQGQRREICRTVLNLVTPRQRWALIALTRMALPEATAALSRWTPPGMVLIPAGPFRMGSSESSHESPVHDVWVDAFWIDRYPVTNAQWAAFLEEGGWQRRVLWTEAGWEWRKERAPEPDHWDQHRHKRDHPVRGICWYEALAYARWAGKALLSEAQWEKAARGEDQRRYPWGGEFDKNKCNVRASGFGDTTPVSTYSPVGDSTYGVADMAGNVWEWCCSRYASYPYDAVDHREMLEGTQTRAMRGGSFRSEFSARSAYRLAELPYFRDWYCGVRVGVGAASLSPLLAVRP